MEVLSLQFEFAENERSKLDPLPEEKPATTNTTTSTTPSSDTYKRVYPDWKPSTTIEKMDVAANIEAIEESRARDKSAWRKSNLNVPNSFEEIEPQIGHRSSSRTSPIAPVVTLNTPLQSIVEEDRRKKQHPTELSDYEPVYQKQDTGHVGITSDQHSIYIRPLDRLNKIEIDSDNIETPPAIRRNIGSAIDAKSTPIGGNSPRKSMANEEKASSSSSVTTTKSESFENTNENDPLGDGQFDRYSLARRTRRYRRPADHNSGTEERTDTTPDTPSSSEPSVCLNEIKSPTRETIVENNIKVLTPVDSKDPSPVNDTKHAHILSRVGKVGRNISSINQEAVREAIRNLKSPTETPERIWSPPREIVAKDKSGIQMASVKVAQHELNDEGFEETQSLVSDTPSHGKDSTSSCNDQTDCKPDQLLERHKSNENGPSSGHNGIESPSKRRIAPKNAVQTLLERNRQSLERSRSLRASNSTAAMAIRNTILPKRTNSLRKSDLNSAQHKRDVERSSSRTSLRSSRSSLNSATSTNTVRNNALKTSLTTGTAAASTRTSPRYDAKTGFKKPLASYNNPTTRGNTSPKHSPAVTSPSARMPASRSSSSGSSIGQSPRRTTTNSSTIKTNGLLSSNPMPNVYSNNNNNNNSFKEDQSSATLSPTRPAFRNAVSNSSHSPSFISSSNGSTNRSQPSSRLTTLTKGIAAKTSNRVNNFMRPTTASATKMSATSAKGK